MLGTEKPMENQEFLQSFKVPMEWKEGPVKNSKWVVTDKVFLILFILNCVSVCSGILWSMSIDHKENNFNPWDSQGNQCGSELLKEYPYLYLQQFGKEYKSVCVKLCPSFDYNKINQEEIQQRANLQMDLIELMRQKDSQIKLKSMKINLQQDTQYDQELFRDYFSQDDYENYRKSLQVECYPNESIKECTQSDEFQIYDSYSSQENYCVPLNPKVALEFNKIIYNQHKDFFQDIAYLKCHLIKAMIIIFILCIIISRIQRIKIVFIQQLIYYAISLAIIFLGIILYLGLQNKTFGFIDIKYNQLQIYRVVLQSFVIRNKLYLIITSMAIILYGIVGLIKGFANRQAFRKLNTITEYESKINIGQFQELFLSLIMLGFQTTVALLIIQSIKNIYSFQEVAFSQIPTSPFVYRNWSIFYAALIIRLFIGGLWILKFLNGYKNYLIVSLTVNKYFKPQIPSWRVFLHSIGYNIGTQAGFSLLNIFSVFALIGKMHKKLNFLVKIFGNKDLTISYIGSLSIYESNKMTYELYQRNQKSVKDAKKLINSKMRQTRFLLSIIFMCLVMCQYYHRVELLQNVFNLGYVLFTLFCIGHLIAKTFIYQQQKSLKSILICYMIEKELYNEYQIPMTKCPQELRDVFISSKEEYLNIW